MKKNLKNAWTDGYHNDIVIDGAIVKLNWEQGSPFNYVVRRSFNGGVNDYVAGCGPVAIGQIMAFHAHPAKCKWNLVVPYLKVNYNGRTYKWKMI